MVAEALMQTTMLAFIDIKKNHFAISYKIL